MATRIDPLTTDQVADLLATVITGVAGGTEARWREAIGSVERVPTWKHVAFNWLVTPAGKPAEREVIARAVEIVRAEHPYITE